MVVSPGNVVRSAPWAQPSLTASSGRLIRQQAIDEPGCKAIAAADAIQHIQFRLRRNVSLPVNPGNSAPRVAIGGMHLAQRGGDDLYLRVLLDHVVDHAKERARVELVFAWTSGPGMPRPFWRSSSFPTSTSTFFTIRSMTSTA